MGYNSFINIKTLSTTPPSGDCDSAENAIKNARCGCFEDSTQGMKAVHEWDRGRLLGLPQERGVDYSPDPGEGDASLKKSILYSRFSPKAII
jgi:hypothetical protein